MDSAIEKGFHCALIGVYAGNLVHERRRVLWEELLSLKAALMKIFHILLILLLS
jgi:hypothetical protein